MVLTFWKIMDYDEVPFYPLHLLKLTNIKRIKRERSPCVKVHDLLLWLQADFSLQGL